MIDTDGLHKIRLNYSEDSADGSKLNEDELIDFSEDQDNQVKNLAILFRKCELLCCILNGQLKSSVHIVDVHCLKLLIFTSVESEVLVTYKNLQVVDTEDYTFVRLTI